MEPWLLRPADIQKLLGLSRTEVYRLVHRKDFPVIRFGKAIRVPADALRDWLKQQAQGFRK
ncbi:MAG: helix-turn-helix domain-containing protein [Syntrophothermus sp.]|uniref:helix-turn-helix domain-containing protein n=1 Tax=Syntrophothermus sp. TaxID=2736299 RepID=UPI00338D992F|nr:helix-turn-helix domain-containing protein [Syntrophothermus sp.]